MEKEMQDELFEKALECQKKYEKKEIETIKKVLVGEITSNKQMIDELKVLNFHYLCEAREYNPGVTDLNPYTIECYEDAEKRGDDVVAVTYILLSIFNIATKNEKMVFVNDEGMPCDENGVLLSKDLEHRVFEVVKGGKYDK